jgi:thiol-disulfide isomerase/thioredoxin
MLNRVKVLVFRYKWQLLLVAILLLAMYFYKSDRRILAYNEYFSDGGAQIALFHADWCGHCKKFMPEWKRFMNKLKDDATLSAKVSAVSYESKERADMMEKYAIKSFPTIMYISGDGTTTEYKGERTAAALMEWVKTQSL